MSVFMGTMGIVLSIMTLALWGLDILGRQDRDRIIQQLQRTRSELDREVASLRTSVEVRDLEIQRLEDLISRHLPDLVTTTNRYGVRVEHLADATEENQS